MFEEVTWLLRWNKSMVARTAWAAPREWLEKRCQDVEWDTTTRMQIASFFFLTLRRQCCSQGTEWRVCPWCQVSSFGQKHTSCRIPVVYGRRQKRELASGLSTLLFDTYSMDFSTANRGVFALEELHILRRGRLRKKKELPPTLPNLNSALTTMALRMELVPENHANRRLKIKHC